MLKHPAAAGHYLHVQMAIMMMLIAAIIVIVRSHLGSRHEGWGPQATHPARPARGCVLRPLNKGC